MLSITNLKFKNFKGYTSKTNFKISEKSDGAGITEFLHQIFEKNMIVK